MKKNCTWCSRLDNVLFHNIGILLFRIVVGVFMLLHGWQKLENFTMLSAVFPDPLGVGSTASLVLIILAEFGCSVLIILGLFTRLATIPLIFGMIVAAFVIHGNDAFAVKELSLLYLSLYIALAFIGSGKISFDYLVSKYCGKHCSKEVKSKYS